MDEPIGNYRRTVGLVGASRIGRRVIDLLKAFDFTRAAQRSLRAPERSDHREASNWSISMS